MNTQQRELTIFNNSSAKRKLYISLNNQLARLQQNIMIMEQSIEITVDQLENIGNFGLSHGALFMAANRVLRRDSTRTSINPETDNNLE
ncbi:961_t:CDS:2 [Scutellospora calospora]|uniref:961_t:CDS:1 n=1 Tax=Scutellospora calospora TaxID=85575 RepID=A0ACA9MKS7_9GLOM|nr:961_t:CDS:2 [Scutellospora calospora]